MDSEKTGDAGPSGELSDQELDQVSGGNAVGDMANSKKKMYEQNKQLFALALNVVTDAEERQTSVVDKINS